MKKLSAKQKLRQRRLQKKHEERSLRSKRIHKHMRKYGANSRPPRSGEIGFRKKFITLHIPASLSFEDNQEETLQFFQRFKELASQHPSQRFKIDFTTMEKVGVAAALVLAAELDRWRKKNNLRLRVVDFDDWNPNIRSLFNEMGLFSLLQIEKLPVYDEPDKSVEFVKFTTGRGAEGQAAKELRLAIQDTFDIEVPESSKLYSALIEAMTNAKHHAYPDDYEYKHPPLKLQWWMVGSFDKVKNNLTIVFFDQGIGIPRTIPRKNTREAIEFCLAKLGLKNNDASLIRAAMELNRSGTEQSNRGYGLYRNIRNYADSMPEGNFRVLSGKGEYRYSPHNDAFKNGEYLLTLNSDIGGTLIQWDANL
ncbi:hypothetical protein [Sneathiella limimaris]|uniref:hypothetical protein n=1 Tax=Sneathiella limimaris TaxID=1964213 RepID=UPI00146CAB6F|nr:hypothetical protein [Sneathiella limimaris]